MLSLQAVNMLPLLTVSLALGALVSAAPIDNDQLSFAPAGSMKVAFHEIYAMEFDKFRNDGSMLLSWGNALINTNGGKMTVVAGSVAEPGYREASGEDARFRLITGFTQIDANTVIIIDKDNSCIRKLDRVTGLTSTFTGKCFWTPNSQTWGQHADGPADQALFSFPSDVLINKNDPTKLLVLGDVSGSIREIDIATAVTTTLFKSRTDLERPRSAAFDAKDTDILYISARRKVCKYRFSTNEVTLITGSAPAGKKNNKKWSMVDGDYANATFSQHVAGIVALNERYLAVSDKWSNMVRIIDLVEKKVSSMCGASVVTAFKARPQDHQPECDLWTPNGLMYDNGTLYIGEPGFITIKQVTIRDVKPADVIG